MKVENKQGSLQCRGRGLGNVRAERRKEIIQLSCGLVIPGLGSGDWKLLKSFGKK